jgi:1,4-alpha-glucan branching enzyme
MDMKGRVFYGRTEIPPHPAFGSTEDLINLVDQAHEMGMRVI